MTYLQFQTTQLSRRCRAFVFIYLYRYTSPRIIYQCKTAPECSIDSQLLIYKLTQTFQTTIMKDQPDNNNLQNPIVYLDVAIGKEKGQFQIRGYT